MTALKPIENRKVRGVPSTKYPLNDKCAHPECSEPTADPHHAFPRSQIGNSSWFVEIIEGPESKPVTKVTIPHVTGLCREHHDQAEDHRAWIKLEDGVFNWYDKVPNDYEYRDGPTWKLLGPLNPQPGSREGKAKRKRFKGEARRKRKTISLRIPDDTEDGGALWDDLMELVRLKLVKDGLIDSDNTSYPPWPMIFAALTDWVNHS